MQGPAGNASRAMTGGPPPTASAGAGERGCENGAFMDSFGIFLQGLLGVVAFSTLMLKRFREPKHERRPWRIWFLDTSKQAIGMLFIHFANVYLSDLTEEDPCSLYLINFLLDATLGMLLIYAGVRAVSVLVEWQQWESLRFGEYGDPLQCGAWVGQCALYIVIMMFEKTIIIIVLLIPQWKKVCIFLPAFASSLRASLARGACLCPKSALELLQLSSVPSEVQTCLGVFFCELLRCVPQFRQTQQWACHPWAAPHLLMPVASVKAALFKRLMAS
uniref:STIM activating enhancer n=1 Tax=Sarcophilus harrisii TaxID=9305 RepID=A0A7N4Q093_SARHA